MHKCDIANNLIDNYYRLQKVDNNKNKSNGYVKKRGHASSLSLYGYSMDGLCNNSEGIEITCAVPL